MAATRWTVRHATQSEVGYLLSGLWKGRGRRTERGAKREKGRGREEERRGEEGETAHALDILLGWACKDTLYLAHTKIPKSQKKEGDV